MFQRVSKVSTLTTMCHYILYLGFDTLKASVSNWVQAEDWTAHPTVNVQQAVENVFTYFETFYIRGRLRANNTRTAVRLYVTSIFDIHRILILFRYPIVQWNNFDRVNNDFPRTQNNIEGWHHRWNRKCGEAHPNIWKFLHVMREEQAVTEGYIHQYRV